MALGPGGERNEGEAAAGPAGEELRFAQGLEAMIDRALERHPRGRTFVYGIHQELSGPTLEYLRARFVAAGWAGVDLREGATGAYLLVLTP